MSVYDTRKAGREYCQTEGSEHYKTEDKVEPIDLIIALGHGEGFCIGSIIKYAARFKRTQNLDDLKKASDYSQILCGVKLGELHGAEAPKTGRVVCADGYCTSPMVNASRRTDECRAELVKNKGIEWFAACPSRSGVDE